MKKTLITALVTVLLCFGLAGTTYAWLVAKTDPITNTFTAGNINITLAESAPRNNRMLPGATFTEDPKVTVKANSEDCWLFIKAAKSANFDTFLDITAGDGWIALDGEEGVFYREVARNETQDQVFYILKDNEVRVKTEPTKEQYDAIGEANRPTVSFTAYAVQKLGFATAADAWVEAKKLEQVVH